MRELRECVEMRRRRLQLVLEPPSHNKKHKIHVAVLLALVHRPAFVRASVNVD